MKFPRILVLGIKCVKYIIENHKKELVLGALMLAIFVAVAAAVVYNSMHMQGTVGVEP